MNKGAILVIDDLIQLGFREYIMSKRNLIKIEHLALQPLVI